MYVDNTKHFKQYSNSITIFPVLSSLFSLSLSCFSSVPPFLSKTERKGNKVVSSYFYSGLDAHFLSLPSTYDATPLVVVLVFSLSSSARRSRLRRLTRGIPNVGHRRVDDQLRLPHGLRVRRRVRAETGHSHQRQHHRLANRGDFQRRLIFRTGGE